MSEKTDLLWPGRGDGWWIGEDDRTLAVQRGDDVWIRRDGSWSLEPEVDDILPRGDSLVAIRDAPASSALPMGARRARALPLGDGATWRSEGFLYRHTRGTTRPVGRLRGDHVVIGPYGGALFGDILLSHGAAPGRSAQALPCRLQLDSVRWSADGGQVAGLDRRSQAVRLDLERVALLDRREGVPVDARGTVLDEEEGVIRRGTRVLFGPLGAASPARLDTWLAGPGGVIWDLTEPRRMFSTPRVELGATAGLRTRSGPCFLTVHWETGSGHWLAPDGTILDVFTIPLEEGDLVSGAVADGDAVVVVTALGSAFRVAGAAVSPSNPVRIPTPSTSLELGSRHYSWDEDGWLFSS